MKITFIVEYIPHIDIKAPIQTLHGAIIKEVDIDIEDEYIKDYDLIDSFIIETKIHERISNIKQLIKYYPKLKVN